MKAKDARDLARLLQVTRRGYARSRRIAVLLGISDRRTMNRLWERAGFKSLGATLPTMTELIARQELIPRDHEALQLLIQRLVHGQEPAAASRATRKPWRQ